MPRKRLNIWRGLVLVLGLAVFFIAIRILGNFTRESVRGSTRYTVAFSSIDCPAPPAQSRAEFLAEVQYLAGVGDRVQLLDQDLPARLAVAFARHPWVKKVERVTITSPPGMRVEVVYRTPVLRVLLASRVRQSGFASSGGKQALDPSPPNEPTWLLDEHGIVLTPKDYREPLPFLFVETGPAAPAGQPWGEPLVEAAARTAGYLRPQQSALRLTSFETGPGRGLVLRTPAGTRVLWGSAPGSEQTSEMQAAGKLRQLLQYCTDHEDLDKPAGPYEHDVRPLEGATHRPLDL
jgi:hypothetical protein